MCQCVVASFLVETPVHRARPARTGKEGVSFSLPYEIYHCYHCESPPQRIFQIEAKVLVGIADPDVPVAVWHSSVKYILHRNSPHYHRSAVGTDDLHMLHLHNDDLIEATGEAFVGSSAADDCHRTAMPFRMGAMTVDSVRIDFCRNNRRSHMASEPSDMTPSNIHQVVIATEAAVADATVGSAVEGTVVVGMSADAMVAVASVVSVVHPTLAPKAYLHSLRRHN